MATLTNNEIARAIYLNSKDKKGDELKASLRKSVKFLYRRNLLGKKENIILRLQKIINESNGIVVARVWSPKKLETGLKIELITFLKKHYSAKEVELEEKIDEKLLGGVKIEINNEVIDLTIKKKILQLKKHLTGETR